MRRGSSSSWNWRRMGSWVPLLGLLSLSACKEEPQPSEPDPGEHRHRLLARLRAGGTGHDQR